MLMTCVLVAVSRLPALAASSLPVSVDGRPAVSEPLPALMDRAAIQPQGLGPSFGEEVKNVTATKGRDAVLTCVTENLQGYKVAWIKVDTQTILTIGSHLITRDYQISLSQSDGRVWHLRISHVDRTDSGWYMCQINTDPMISRQGYLEVVEPPDIVLKESSDDMSLHEGEDATLRCVARGYPKPLIKWFKEDGSGQPLVSSPGMTVNDTDIIFTPVRRHHMAVYLCIASNGVPPSVSKRIVLQVQFAPLVNVTQQLMAAAKGTSVTLRCATEAHPTSVVYWWSANAGVLSSGVRYKVKNISHGYKLEMRLQILKVDGSDFTTYKCVAKNPHGESDGTIRLTERAPTDAERRLLAAGPDAEEARRRQLLAQQEAAAARAAHKLREQRRRQEERRRQRARQRHQSGPSAPDSTGRHGQRPGDGAPADRATEGPPHQTGAAGASAAPLPLSLLLSVLLLLLPASAAGRRS
ncbi:lachesin-like isoform X1 [Amphibalanus amphitrite]|uniref:lachesin-like isoform X1 n=1 Tax=Amphibalanus amphitrite TaxID=1232801 RepID=UPI001C905411|nr:lachesin-like isoform X1 [Amphibalanus amphitrite]XP_043220309.1 lachesin-like isoform X1 [Amphibalanus amphitrite]